MTTRAFFLVVFLLGLFFHFLQTAWAEPKEATFEDMIKSSTTIVMAKFLGDQPDDKKKTIRVEVTKALKGDLKPGKHHFKFEDSPQSGEKGEEFIAFLDKDHVWRFIASPLKGNKTDRGILQVSGFYDDNAYWVIPGLVTLNQLKTYLKERSLVYRFRGEVYFPESGKTDWKPGSLVISGTYDVVTKKVNVKGLPNLKGFPAQPKVFIHSDDDPNLDLSYSRTSNRPLNLIGKVQGIDNKTGEIKVRFAASAPEVLTQKAFEEYLGDASKGTCYYKFKLKCAPKNNSTIPKALILTMGKWTDNRFNSTVLEGFGKSPVQVFGTSYNGPNRRSGSYSVESSRLPKTMVDEGSKEDWVLRMNVQTEAGEFLTIGFEIGEPKQGRIVFSWFPKNELLYTLYRSQVKGTITLHEGKTARTVATFTTAFDSIGFNRNEEK